LPNESNLFQLGEVRDLNQILRAGGPDTFDAYRRLVGLLLRSTVMHEHGAIKLARSNDPSRYKLGGRTPLDPVPLTNGHFLRLHTSLYLAPEPPHHLKTEVSSYQYQLDQRGDEWIFRYDYSRIQQGAHPPAHLQIRGELTERSHVEAPEVEHIHFATGRVSLEAVIRTLIEEFHVPAQTDPSFWRPILALSEQDFLDVVHQPLSGPDR
jgi:hypothetical protein